MILNESSCNFSYCKPIPHIYSEKLSSNQNQLVLVSHTQLSLGQSDSKILETPVTQEKPKLFNFFFASEY